MADDHKKIDVNGRPISMGVMISLMVSLTAIAGIMFNNIGTDVNSIRADLRARIPLAMEEAKSTATVQAELNNMRTALGGIYAGMQEDDNRELKDIEVRAALKAGLTEQLREVETQFRGIRMRLDLEVTRLEERLEGIGVWQPEIAAMNERLKTLERRSVARGE